MFDNDNMNKDRRKYINNIYLLMSILLVSFLIYLGEHLFATKGNYLELSYMYNGEKTNKYISLVEDQYILLTFNTDIHTLDKIYFYDSLEDVIMPSADYNLIHIYDEKVDCVGASCPDKICVHTKDIKNNHEMICCLPHNLFLTVINSNETNELENPDAITW